MVILKDKKTLETRPGYVDDESAKKLPLTGGMIGGALDMGGNKI